MRLVTGILALSLLAACGDAPGTPEAQVRAVLHAMERAAEEGDVSAIRELVSEAYQDDRGNDKRELVRYVAFHVLRNQQRHVLARVRDVEIRDASRAEVRLHAGLAGSDIASFDALASLRADVYAFALEFALEAPESWRLVRAAWQRTQPTDLL